MAITNSLELENAKATLQRLKDEADRIKTNLNKIDGMIQDKVNTGIGIWDGQAATEFRAQWSNVASEIPSYIQDFNNQVNNLSAAIEELKIADEQ